mmetsp:Transcript_7619/g.13050  ORF Transcript_7619/g.13050 Transcript_7619/m.13050 type:complete len:298 (-) Transcript_7619:717-1610(-)
MMRSTSSGGGRGGGGDPSTRLDGPASQHLLGVAVVSVDEFRLELRDVRELVAGVELHDEHVLVGLLLIRRDRFQPLLLLLPLLSDAVLGGLDLLLDGGLHLLRLLRRHLLALQRLGHKLLQVVHLPIVLQMQAFAVDGAEDLHNRVDLFVVLVQVREEDIRQAVLELLDGFLLHLADRGAPLHALEDDNVAGLFRRLALLVSFLLAGICCHVDVANPVHLQILHGYYLLLGHLYRLYANLRRRGPCAPNGDDDRHMSHFRLFISLSGKLHKLRFCCTEQVHCLISSFRVLRRQLPFR